MKLFIVSTLVLMTLQASADPSFSNISDSDFESITKEVFNDIISHISNFFSLNIGDMVFTGTPAGVGECVVGDLLEGFIAEKKMFELEIK